MLRDHYTAARQCLDTMCRAGGIGWDGIICPLLAAIWAGWVDGKDMDLDFCCWLLMMGGITVWHFRLQSSWEVGWVYMARWARRTSEECVQRCAAAGTEGMGIDLGGWATLVVDLVIFILECPIHRLVGVCLSVWLSVCLLTYIVVSIVRYEM